MPIPPGRTIRLSLSRRFMCDFLHFSRKVPLVGLERRLQIAPLVAARRRAAVRPSWFAIFAKAWALVSEAQPELRRSYLSFPWPRLHEHPLNIASIAIAREIDGQSAIIFHLIRYPERHSLQQLDASIREARTGPLMKFIAISRQRRLAWLPWPLRRAGMWTALNCVGRWRARFAGTFGLTGVAAFGAMSVNVLSPLTTTLTYGVIEPDGSILVRLFFDHRVLDGIGPAQAMGRLEETLNGPLSEELAIAAQAE